MPVDVAIIGSGLGGLECAKLLSDCGLRVLVLERESQPGGCMQSYRRNGLGLDTGLHYIGGLAEGQPLHRPFQLLGLLDLPWQRLDADGFDRVTYGGKTYRLAEGMDNFARTLAQDFPTEREALSRYTEMLSESNRSQWDTLRPDYKGNPLNSEAMNTGAWDWLERNFSDPRLVQVISGNALRMELNRTTLPLFTFAHSNGAYVESSWRLRGDGNMLVDKLIEGISANGGRVVTNAEAAELIESEGRVVALRCADGTEVEARWFVSDVHPAVTLSWLKQSQVVRRIYRRRISSLPNTFGMLTAQLVLKPGVVEYFNHNHFVYSAADVWDFYNHPGPVSGVMISCRVPADGRRYARQVDLLTPITWQQVQPWEQTTVGRRGQDYTEWKQRKADECISLAETVMPGLREAVEHVYISTPLTYRDYTLTPQGSAFGLRKDYHQPLLTTLSPRTPLPNLLLTGQNLMLHGVQGVTMTALATCAELVGKDTIWNKLKL